MKRASTAGGNGSSGAELLPVIQSVRPNKGLVTEHAAPKEVLQRTRQQAPPAHPRDSDTTIQHRHRLRRRSTPRRSSRMRSSVAIIRFALGALCLTPPTANTTTISL